MSGVSKSQVSRLCGEIDDKVNGFLDRSLEGDWPYLWLDATYVKVREAGRIVSVAVTVAVAVNDQGRREDEWMRKNLEYAVFPFSGEVKQLEARLIDAHGPPLNLKGWRNPQGRVIRRLRGLCRDEARRFGGETG